jgi:hypothetical protein
MKERAEGFAFFVDFAFNVQEFSSNKKSVVQQEHRAVIVWMLHVPTIVWGKASASKNPATGHHLSV